MAYCLDQFGPALKLPWTRLVAPELTPELRKRMVDGAEEMAGGKDFWQLTREMNDGLVAIAKALNEVRAKYR
jgi:carnitine 3-dehydrogenase